MTNPPSPSAGPSCAMPPEERALQQEVSTWYHLQATEMPPKQIDEDILALSRSQLSARNVAHIPAPTFWQRLPWAVTSAASLVVLLGLMMLNRPQFDQDMPRPLADNVAVLSTKPPAMVAQVMEAQVMEAQIHAAQPAPMQAPMSARAPQLVQAPQLAQAPRVAGGNASEGSVTAEKLEVPLAAALKQLQLLIDNKDFVQALALEQQILAEYPELNTLTKVSGDNVEAHNGVTAKLWKEFNVIQQQLHQAVR
ncbi:MAG: hypothetical protein ACRCVV_08810 [Shewanella sp.]